MTDQTVSVLQPVMLVIVRPSAYGISPEVTEYLWRHGVELRLIL